MQPLNCQNYKLFRSGLIAGLAQQLEHVALVEFHARLIEGIDTTATDGAVYTVRAIYGDKGASAESDAATYTASSVLSPVSGDIRIKGIYTPAGIRIEGKPTHGIYIIRYSDGSARKTIL